MAVKRLFRFANQCIKNPMLAYDAARILSNDIKSLLGWYRYPARIIFIAGLPKSGSTWLYNMLLDLPGFNPRVAPSRALLDGDNKFMNNYAEVHENTFNNAPRWGYSVYKNHTRYTPRNWDLITAAADKVVVIHRDLRDVCVSLYHHHKVDRKHHLYRYFESLDASQGIELSMKIVREEHIPWIQGWLGAINEHRGNILEVRYENLWEDPQKELGRVLSFYGIEVHDRFYARLAATKISASEDLKTNLETQTRLLRINTARKGGTGGWREYFSEKQKETFKSFAGQFLVELGYEKNLDW